MTVKKLRCNKGFTLVELVAAFAILAVVMLSVGYAIGTGSRTYGRIAADINLQYESQLAMSQLQEYIIDCNTCVGVSPGGGSLYIVNKTDASYEAFKFARNPDGDELFFYKAAMDAFDPAAPDFSAAVFDPGQPMSGFVKSFSAAVSNAPDTLAAGSVIITIHFGTGGETYVGCQTFALRNPVPNISSSVPEG